MSLRSRLTLTYTVLVAVIVAVFSIVLYVTMRLNLGAEMDRRLAVRASQAELTIWPDTRSLRPDDLTAAKLDLSPLEELKAPGLYVQVSDLEGNPIAASESLRGAALPLDRADLSSIAQGKQEFDDVLLEGSRPMRLLSVPVKVRERVVGVLTVGQSRQSLQDTMDRLLVLLGASAAVALAIAGGIGWVVADRGLQPLAAMARRAAAIAAGRDFSRRLDHQGPADEVGRLAKTIDGLLAAVEEAMRQHRDFVADASHELRNPLLAIRTNLELVGRMPSREERAECVREALKQVERMSTFVNDLLTLARSEAGLVIERQPVSLRSVVERAVREAGARANGQILRLERADDVYVLGDEGRLIQVVGNLLDNAVRYSDPHGTVTLVLERVGEGAQVAVEDEGEGIPPEHLPRIFERFYRVKPTGTDKGGAGVGLAVVKHLVEAHDGWVSAESQPGKGSRFVVWLPAISGNPRPPATRRRRPGASRSIPSTSTVDYLENRPRYDDDDSGGG